MILWAAVHGSYVEDYLQGSEGGLTVTCHGYIIGNKSNEGQDTPSRIGTGDANLRLG